MWSLSATQLVESKWIWGTKQPKLPDMFCQPSPSDTCSVPYVPELESNVVGFFKTPGRRKAVINRKVEVRGSRLGEMSPCLRGKDVLLTGLVPGFLYT